MTEKDARLQADEDIREFIRRDFFKLYTNALEQEISLNINSVHREMISEMKILVDETSLQLKPMQCNYTRTKLMSCSIKKMNRRMVISMTLNLKIELYIL